MELKLSKWDTPVNRNSFYYDLKLSMDLSSPSDPRSPFDSGWKNTTQILQILPRCCFQSLWQSASEVISLPSVSARNLLGPHHPPKTLLLSRSVDVLVCWKPEVGAKETEFEVLKQAGRASECVWVGLKSFLWIFSLLFSNHFGLTSLNLPLLPPRSLQHLTTGFATHWFIHLVYTVGSHPFLSTWIYMCTHLYCKCLRRSPSTNHLNLSPELKIKTSFLFF